MEGKNMVLPPANIASIWYLLAPIPWWFIFEDPDLEELIPQTEENSEKLKEEWEWKWKTQKRRSQMFIAKKMRLKFEKIASD